MKTYQTEASLHYLKKKKIFMWCEGHKRGTAPLQLVVLSHQSKIQAVAVL